MDLPQFSFRECYIRDISTISVTEMAHIFDGDIHIEELVQMRYRIKSTYRMNKVHVKSFHRQYLLKCFH